MQLQKQNIFNTTTAAIKFVLFWVMVVIQLPILLILPRGDLSVRYMRVFMWILVKLSGVRVVVHGKLSDARPLMIVSNHISVFEIATFPSVFRGSFIAKKEMEKAVKELNFIEAAKYRDLIIALEGSGSFARTHSIIAELAKHKWNGEERETLFNIAIENSQVFYILEDEDVKRFYKTLLKGSKSSSENAQEIRKILG